MRGVSRQKYGFYECGFLPRQNRAITFQMHAYTIIVLTLIYEAEGFILLILFLNIQTFALLDMLFVASFVLLFLLGFVVDLLFNVNC